MKKLILEMRLNEYKTREQNRHIPYTPDEIAEAAADARKAGASIVHFHARTGDGGASFDPEVYAECAAKIRERCDILLDVTLGQVNVAGDDNRLAHIVHMARSPRTIPDFAAVDTGSTNVDAYDAATKTFKSTHRAYVNSTATCIRLINDMQAMGVQPSISLWTVPFIRTCEALIDALTFWCAGYRNVTSSYGVEGFTSEHLGLAPHHTSPPRKPQGYADFCAEMVHRYAR